MGLMVCGKCFGAGWNQDKRGKRKVCERCDGSGYERTAEKRKVTARVENEEAEE